MEKSYKEIMPQISTFIFDVDGVLTDGTVTIFPNGELVRTMNIKDGYALKTAVDMGYNVCIISGGTNPAVKSRLQALGITDIYLGAHHKKEQLDEYLDLGHFKCEGKCHFIEIVQFVGKNIGSLLENAPLPTMFSKNNC